MTIQKIASKIQSVWSLVPANKAPAGYTSAAFTLATYGYPRTARLGIGGTVNGGTLNGYLMDNSTGSHTKITGSDCPELTTNAGNFGPEVRIRAGATEVKSVITSGTVTEGIAGVIEFGELSFEA